MLAEVFCFVVFGQLYSFKLERIQHNNINILSRTVLFLFLFLIHVLFLFGWGGGGGGGGGALAFMKKTGV